MFLCIVMNVLKVSERVIIVITVIKYILKVNRITLLGYYAMFAKNGFTKIVKNKIVIQTSK